MRVTYHGKNYMLVDIDYDDNFIYDILEDENGKRYKVISGYIN